MRFPLCLLESPPFFTVFFLPPTPNPELDIQLFIKPNQVTNLHSVQNDYPTTGYVGPLLGSAYQMSVRELNHSLHGLDLKHRKRKQHAHPSARELLLDPAP